MDSNTIHLLNQLNSKFYNLVADDFHQTRQTPWAGWKKLTETIKKISSKKIDSLDIGCGNGRWGIFLAENFPQQQFTYTGIDNNQQLLDFAQKNLTQNNINTTFIQNDIISLLLDSNKSLSSFFIKKNLPQKFNLLTAFGLLHHIPSYQLRLQLLQELYRLSDHQGMLILTIWQFMDDDKLSARTVDPKTILNIDSSQLEPDDYILDWQRGKRAYRYCHFINPQEQQQLIDQSGWKIQKTFVADGKSDKLNQYLVLKK